MYMAQIPNNYTINFGVVSLFMEITTLFINTRWLLFQHKVVGGSCLQSVNSALLFVSFTLCRIVFQLYMFFGGGGVAYTIAVVCNLNGD